MTRKDTNHADRSCPKPVGSLRQSRSWRCAKGYKKYPLVVPFHFRNYLRMYTRSYVPSPSPEYLSQPTLRIESFISGKVGESNQNLKDLNPKSHFYLRMIDFCQGKGSLPRYQKNAESRLDRCSPPSQLLGPGDEILDLSRTPFQLFFGHERGGLIGWFA